MELCQFISMTMHWWYGVSKNTKCLQINNNSSKPKTPLCSTSQSWGLRKSDVQWPLELGSLHSGTTGSPDGSCGYFPSSGIHSWNTQTQHLPEPKHWLPGPWINMRAISLRKGRWKSLELCGLTKRVNQSNPGSLRDCRDQWQHRDVGIVIPQHIHSHPIFIQLRYLVSAKSIYILKND